MSSLRLYITPQKWTKQPCKGQYLYPRANKRTFSIENVKMVTAVTVFAISILNVRLFALGCEDCPLHGCFVHFCDVCSSSLFAFESWCERYMQYYHMGLLDIAGGVAPLAAAFEGIDSDRALGTYGGSVPQAASQ